MDRLGMPSGLSRSETAELLASGKAALHNGGPGSPASQEKRISRTFTVLTDRGNLRCTLTEPRKDRKELEGVFGVLVLVHSPPFGSSESAPLPDLAHKLSCGSVRVDLTGCGASSGEPASVSVDRDADDIRCVVEHLRHEQSVQQLKDRAKGLAPPTTSEGRPPPAVLGVVGVGLGGTAALRYAALHSFPDPLPFIVTVSACATSACALRGTLNWGDLEALQRDGEVVVTRHAGKDLTKPLRVTQEDLDAAPDLSGCAQPTTHYLVLHGSKDSAVPPAEASQLEENLSAGGAKSVELRVVPGVASDWQGHEPTLSYAIGDWLWRRTQQGDAAPGENASGFNVFVDDLGAKVREIHAGTRMALPSINSGLDDDDDDDDDDE
jgi:dienelactone hydrolase